MRSGGCGGSRSQQCRLGRRVWRRLSTLEGLEGEVCEAGGAAYIAHRTWAAPHGACARTGARVAERARCVACYGPRVVGARLSAASRHGPFPTRPCPAGTPRATLSHPRTGGAKRSAPLGERRPWGARGAEHNPRHPGFCGTCKVAHCVCLHVCVQGRNAAACSLFLYQFHTQHIRGQFQPRGKF